MLGAFQGRDYHDSIFVFGLLEVLSKSVTNTYSTEEFWREEKKKKGKWSGISGFV